MTTETTEHEHEHVSRARERGTSRLQQDGFDIVGNVLPPARLDAIATELDASLPPRRAGARNLLQLAVVAKLAHDATLLELARQALGTGATPFKATLFDKRDDANWLVAWHQDTVLPLRARREEPGWGPWSTKAGILHANAPADVLAAIVAIRVHLDDSTAANGSLKVLPGTHTLGILDDGQIAALSARATAVDCLADPGACVVMRPLLLHASSKAKSPARRRVLHIEYAPSLDLPGGMQLAVA